MNRRIRADALTFQVLTSYDGEGRRVSMSDAGGVRRYLVAPTGDDELESPHMVLDGLGAIVAGYSYVGDAPLARVEGGAASYYLEDGLGSVIGVTDASGARTADLAYDAFGNVRRAVGPDATPGTATGGDFRFQHMWLDPSGLYYARARVYDPETGRFTSRDPVEGDPDRPETYQPYVFANGNPMAFSDRSGSFSLAELSVANLVERTLQGIRAGFRNYIKDYVRQEAEEQAGKLFANAIAQMVPGGGPLFAIVNLAADAYQAGRLFEQIAMNNICGLIPGATAGGVNPLYLSVGINKATGKPTTNGFQCGEARHHGGINTRISVVPDAMLSPFKPTDLDTSSKRSFVMVELKLSPSAIRRNRQFMGIVRHAANYGMHVAVWVTLRNTSNADVARIRRWTASQRVAGFVYGILFV